MELMKCAACARARVARVRRTYGGFMGAVRGGTPPCRFVEKHERDLFVDDYVPLQPAADVVDAPLAAASAAAAGAGPAFAGDGSAGAAE